MKSRSVSILNRFIDIFQFRILYTNLLELAQSILIRSKLSLKGLMAHVLGMEVFGIPVEKNDRGLAKLT